VKNELHEFPSTASRSGTNELRELLSVVEKGCCPRYDKAIGTRKAAFASYRVVNKILITRIRTNYTNGHWLGIFSDPSRIPVIISLIRSETHLFDGAVPIQVIS
jgi:hypothetical protein